MLKSKSTAQLKTKGETEEILFFGTAKVSAYQ